MEPYARAYLQLASLCRRRSTNAETFVFATRLTRLTRQLRIRNPNVALQRAAASAPDWAGGTRLGDALKAFNDGWGRRGLARGAVLLIVSDGWDAGEPDGRRRADGPTLTAGAHRSCGSTRGKQSSSYQPLVGGMAAALPYVDAFISGHSLDAMHDVLEAIGQATRSPDASVMSRDLGPDRGRPDALLAARIDRHDCAMASSEDRSVLGWFAFVVSVMAVALAMFGLRSESAAGAAGAAASGAVDVTSRSSRSAPQMISLPLAGRHAADQEHGHDGAQLLGARARPQEQPTSTPAPPSS